MCRENERYLYQQTGLICSIQLLELSFFEQKIQVVSERLLSQCKGKLPISLASVIDLREDQPKHTVCCICMLSKVRLFLPCDLSVAWFYASFSEIPRYCFPEALHPRGQPGGRRLSGHFRDGLLHGAKFGVKMRWAQVSVRLLGGRDPGTVGSVCGFVPQIHHARCSRW